MKRKIMLLLSTVVVAATSFTGCGSTQSSGAGGVDKDQHITIAFSKNNTQTIDPSKGTDSVSVDILQESLEALAREEIKDGKDVFVPAGAKSWDVSQDGKKWTFHLRDNKWSDGKAVTADQYAYSIKRTLDPKVASGYAYLLTGAGIAGAADYYSGKGSADNVGAKAIDDKTLEITLDHPCGYFEKLLANKLFAPQRQDMVEKNGDKYGTTAESLVYNGPFKITKFQNGDKVEMVKNDQYWDKASVKLQKVTMLFLKDDNSRMNALQSGQIDSVSVSQKEWVDKFKQAGKYTEIKGDSPSSYINMYNFKNKYLKNYKIRKALSMVIDREDYTKVIAKGIGKPAHAWVPYSVQIGEDEYRSKVQEQFKDTSGDAKALFQEGLKEIGESTDLSKVKIEYLLPGTDSINREEGDYMLNLFKTKLGINLQCDYKEWAQYLDDINKGDYDMCYTDWIADYNDPMTFFDMWETGAGIENNAWSNKDYDALVEDAKSTMDQNKRTEDFNKAEDILVNSQAAVAPLYYGGKEEFTYKYVKNMQSPLFSAHELKYAYTVGRDK